jgi:hypothetical protein
MTQFENFNDYIVFISRCGEKHSAGHYPLGQRVWFHFDGHKTARFYLTRSLKRAHFVFQNFQTYCKRVHSKVLSRCRSKMDIAAADKKREKHRLGRRRGRKEQTASSRWNSHDAFKHADSDAVQQAPESGVSGSDSTVEGEATLPEETENADMSNQWNPGSVLSSRGNTSPWREDDKECFVSPLP